ncbi:hypothetical protein [Streptomyces sp. HPF1205]|uniref:hypothetical protein n=1 Tax=Streptomyces sp. HPF1205 TaxID=2873262 RepID=UPI001CEDF20D|nr:hypothetical protein [Streptomyces sp. HPF1205]
MPVVTAPTAPTAPTAVPAASAAPTGSAPSAPPAPSAAPPPVPLSVLLSASRPACAGLDPRAVFARRVKDAAPALRACARCRLHEACERAVAPAESWFDGVCAGRLWRNGRPVAAATPDPRERP